MFSCPDCLRSFNKEQGLRIHIQKAKHSEDKPKAPEPTKPPHVDAELTAPKSEISGPEQLCPRCKINTCYPRTLYPLGCWECLKFMN